jgi:hypothetical protein
MVLQVSALAGSTNPDEFFYEPYAILESGNFVAARVVFIAHGHTVVFHECQNVVAFQQFFRWPISTTSCRFPLGSFRRAMVFLLSSSRCFTQFNALQSPLPGPSWINTSKGGTASLRLLHYLPFWFIPLPPSLCRIGSTGGGATSRPRRLLPHQFPFPWWFAFQALRSQGSFLPFKPSCSLWGGLLPSWGACGTHGHSYGGHCFSSSGGFLLQSVEVPHYIYQDRSVHNCSRGILHAAASVLSSLGVAISLLQSLPHANVHSSPTQTLSRPSPKMQWFPHRHHLSW